MSVNLQVNWLILLYFLMVLERNTVQRKTKFDSDKNVLCGKVEI